jgi:hypothetical protein
VQAFREHARWLHDYHEKRSDRLGQRAATLVGFAGVVAALLPAGSRPTSPISTSRPGALVGFDSNEHARWAMANGQRPVTNPAGDAEVRASDATQGMFAYIAKISYG